MSLYNIYNKKHQAGYSIESYNPHHRLLEVRMSQLFIRQFTDADTGPADELLNLAFHTSASRAHDLAIYRQLQPDGWFAAEQGRRLVGMVGAIHYGDFAHVGLMAVHPEAQRQGFGMALMQFILAWIETYSRAGQQPPASWLDASLMGRPLYEKLGYTSYDETGIYVRPINPAAPLPGGYLQKHRIQALTPHELDELAPLDRAVFGADRRKVLQALLKVYPQRAFLQRDEAGQIAGYLIAQKNRIGPWVMLQPGQAEALLQTALSLPYEGTLAVNPSSKNKEISELLARHGFEWSRANQHMGWRVSQLHGQRQQVFSQASLALG